MSARVGTPWTAGLTGSVKVNGDWSVSPLGFVTMTSKVPTAASSSMSKPVAVRFVGTGAWPLNATLIPGSKFEPVTETETGKATVRE